MVLVSNKSKEFNDLDIVTITKKEDLTFEKLKKIDPSYIFFLIGIGKFLLKFMKHSNVLSYIQHLCLLVEEVLYSELDY